MCLGRIQSDQLYTWSDNYAPRIRTNRRLAQTSPCSTAPTAATRCYPARISHRAIQALWQAWLQVRRGSRPWPQVLSFGELPRSAAANGLRTTGVLRPHPRVVGQLSARAGAIRATLRDQPRTPASPRGVLTSPHERCASRPSGPRVRRRAVGQHARRLACQRARLVRHREEGR
jgi:hypothetical protein